MTFQDVRKQEEAALMGEGLEGDTLPYAAVEKPQDIVKTPTFLRGVHPVTLVDLPGEARTSVFVQLCPTLHYKFLWVHADHGGYRDSYRAFLRHFHKITETLPSNLHVDHLYNRSRALSLGVPWIRTVLVPDSVNMSHGAGYEKARTGAGKGTAGRSHTMDEIQLMKLCGMPSPRQGEPLTAEMISHVHRVAEFYGMDAKTITQSITNLMAVAAFFSRKKA